MPAASAPGVIGEKRGRVFPLTPAFFAIDAAFWTAVAFLFAIQGRSSSSVSLGASFAHSFTSFVPCILLTPVIGLLSVRFRFARGQQLPSSIAHVVGLCGFVIIGGGMMG